MLAKFKILIFGLLGLFLVPTISLAAIEGEGLTISPPISEMTLESGKTVEGTIKITNPSQKLMEVYPQVADFRAKGEGGEPAFSNPVSGEEKFSLASWIKFTQTKIALTPDQVAEFKYSISVPADVEPGGHYGAIFFVTEPPKATQAANQVAIASSIGSLILLKVPGDIKEEANLEEFYTSKFYLKSPVNFTIRIKNSGNIHFKPKGDITIKNWQGKTLETIPVNQSGGNVLPESIRKFQEIWQPDKWTVGHFSANLNLVYGESNKTLASKASFWIIPWWLIITVSAIVIGIFIMIIRKKRHRLRNQKKKIILR